MVASICGGKIQNGLEDGVQSGRVERNRKKSRENQAQNRKCEV